MKEILPSPQVEYYPNYKTLGVILVMEEKKMHMNFLGKLGSSLPKDYGLMEGVLFCTIKQFCNFKLIAQ